ATFTDDDPAGTQGDYTATVNWGDSSSPEAASVGAPTGGVFPVTSGGHSYAEEGNYTVTVTISDVVGSTTSTTLSAVVADAALHASATTIAAIEGACFSGVVASFSDADPNGASTDYSASIKWGDGQTSAGTVTANGSGGFDVSGTNTYAEEGNDPITVTI